MRTFRKSPFPVEGIRRFLEPGPIVLKTISRRKLFRPEML